MKRTLFKLLFLFAFVCDALAVYVETLDEQVESKNLTVLRLRVNNESDQELHNVKVKYFVQKKPQEILTIEPYDLGGANVSLDSLMEDVWTITLSIDTLHPGVFPYESGICLGFHDIVWQNRDKRRDPSYIASSIFAVNNNVELNLNGNHLPNAKPLVLASGTKILLDNGDSVSFAWHWVPGAERYRLTVYSSDSQLVYQKETFANTERVSLAAGDYLWQVESKNSVTDYGTAGAGVLVNQLLVEDFRLQKILEQNVHGFVSVSGHKDTPMLVVGWGEYADLREWDRPHLGRNFLDENEAYSCWAIAIKNLNQYYGGNLSLDEIRWFVKKIAGVPPKIINVFGFGDGWATGDEGEIIKGLKFALDSTKSYAFTQNSRRPLSFYDVKNYLNNNQEIYINMCWNSRVCHAMLIDAYYATTEGNFVRCVNIDNYGNYGIFFADSLFRTISSYMVIEKPGSVRNMSPLLGVEKYDNFNTWTEWTDTDNDGITDFDEVFRFGTNPNSADSDSDGVKDKDEIHSYTILERSHLNLSGTYVGKNVDLAGMAIIAGIEDEYMADVDGDGLRAERDPDSDNDGIPDSADSEPYRANSAKDSLDPNELPKEVMLYARKQLSVNDGVACESNGNYCIYVSEDTEFDYSMFMGARTSTAYLYARNNVFIRSNPNNTFSVNYYGSESLSTTRPDGKMTVDRHFSLDEWPWNLNIELPDYDEGDSVLVIHSGDTIPLRDNDHFKTLKVESNGVVCLPVGNVYIGNLQLDAGSALNFAMPLYESNLHVKNTLLWHGKFSLYPHIDLKDLARGFRLLYYGYETIFIHSDWSGTIIAPNTKVIFGQTNKKNFYGQAYANEIVIHQYSNLVNVPFKPDLLPLDYAILKKERGDES